MERRKSERVQSTTKATLRVYNAKKAQYLTESFDAWVYDLSPYGSRIRINEIRQEEIHLFYSPQENEDLTVIMQFFADDGDSMKITVIPVWFNKELEQEPSYYLLGVRFDEDTPKKNLKALLGTVKGNSIITRWLGELFRSISNAVMPNRVCGEKE